MSGREEKARWAVELGLEQSNEMRDRGKEKTTGGTVRGLHEGIETPDFPAVWREGLFCIGRARLSP